MTYTNFASLYDHLMKDAPYDKWLRLTMELLSMDKKEVQRIIDLGCGTGEITLRLAKQGFQLYGVDSSQEMLSIAEQKSFKHSLPIQWYKQDLRELEGFQAIDLAISYCDVMNYMTSAEELKNVFSRVYKLLAKDGFFVFDVHSLSYVQEYLIEQTFAEAGEEISYIWECFPGEHKGEMHHELTFFQRQQDFYQRFDEYHHQRTYPIAFYRQLLEKVGFKKINTYADFSLESVTSCEKHERIFFLAKKG